MFSLFFIGTIFYMVHHGNVYRGIRLEIQPVFFVVIFVKIIQCDYHLPLGF